MNDLDYRPADAFNGADPVSMPTSRTVLGPEVDAALTAWAEARGAVSDAAEELNKYASKQAVTAALNADEQAFGEAVAKGKDAGKVGTPNADARELGERVARVKVEQAQAVARQKLAAVKAAWAREIQTGEPWDRATDELDAANAELVKAVEAVQSAYQRVKAAHEDRKRIWDSATREQWHRSRYRTPGMSQRIDMGLGELRGIATAEWTLTNPFAVEHAS